MSKRPRDYSGEVLLERTQRNARLQIFAGGAASRPPLDDILSPTPAAATDQYIPPHPSLREGNTPVEATQLNLEKISVLKGHRIIGYLALKKLISSQLREKCLDTGVGMEVSGFDKLYCFLVRKSFLTCRTPSPANTVKFITAKKVYISGRKFRVTSYPGMLQGKEYCLATFDCVQEATIYDFSFEATQASDETRELIVWKRPPCPHDPNAPCDKCMLGVKHLPVKKIDMADLASGYELMRGNCGEVRIASWSTAGSDGQHNFLDLESREDVVVKRFSNVLMSLITPTEESRYFLDFEDYQGKGLLWHVACVADPLRVLSSSSPALTECFRVRGKCGMVENPKIEVEIMQYLNGHQGRFLALESFGIDIYNLYINSELLPSANLGDLVGRISPLKRVGEDTAKRIMIRIFESTVYMHHHSVVHCDLKPNNIAFRIVEAPTRDVSELRRMISPASTEGLSEDVFQYLEAVIIDFGQARYESHADGTADPLKNQKRTDLIKLGEILCVISGRGKVLLSDMLLDLLNCLSKCGQPEYEFTAADALQHPWFTANNDQFL